MTFVEMLKARWQKADSMVCVGLDTDFSKISDKVREELIRRRLSRNISVKEIMFGFNRAIIDATGDFVCAYKPNIDFYEEQWLDGLEALQETVEYIRQTVPDVPVIFDAKRADIGSTNRGYVRMAFDILGADAITVSPYFGKEALKPFLARKEKGIIVLCRTSNPGAGEFQDLPVTVDRGAVPGIDCLTLPLYQLVASRVAAEWNENGNCLLVVGATYPDELKEVRKKAGDLPILVPGIGAQKGDLEGTVRAGLDSNGFGMIVNSARGIIFASKEADFTEAAAREAKKLRDEINAVKASLRR